jgi:xylulokinase
VTQPTSFLGIDIGTSATKTLAVSAAGDVVASATAPHPSSSPRAGWIEQEPADWWRGVCGTVRDVVGRLDGGAASIAGVGLDGHMSSLVAIDRAGEPLRPCITVADGRGEDEAAWLGEHFGPRLERLAGWRPGTSDVAPKLLWLKANEPDVYARMATFLFAKDHVRFRLTGTIATEPTDAGNTFFLDVVRRTWDIDLYRDVGLDPRTLPGLVKPTEVVGKVTPGASAATGLVAGTPVIAGAADMAASVTGTATIEPGIVAVTIGTSAQLTTPVRELLPQARGRVDFHPHAAPDRLYLLGSIFSGGLTMQWLARAFGEEKELADRGSAYFDDLSVQAEQSPIGSDGALFLPYLVGSGTPDFDPAMQASFVGLSLGIGRPQLVRAALEGAAFNTRECLDIVRELGLPVERIHLAGGGAASRPWRRIMAEVLGVRLIPIRVRDASAVGAAALAAVGLEAFPDIPTASSAMVAFERPLEPDPSAVEHYDRSYRTYLDASRQLREVYHRRAAESAFAEPESSQTRASR